MKETERHKHAFEYYYALGAKRSCPQVARKLSVSNNSVKKWRLAFNWQEKVMMRERAISQNVVEKVIKEEEDIRIAIYNELKQEGQIYTAQEVTAFYKKDGKTHLKAECTPKSSTELTRVQEGKRKNLESQIKILAPEEGKADLGEIHIIFEDIEPNDRKTRKKIKEVSNVSE